MIERLIVRLLTALAPPHLRNWIVAMLAEGQQLDGRDRLSWYCAAAKVAVTLRAVRSAFLQASALALAMLVVDWAWGALFPALALIALSAVVLTRSAVRNSIAAPIVAGGTLPLAHGIANWVPALRPQYQFAPLDLRDWATLAAVGAIGLCAVRIAGALWTARDSVSGDR